MDNRDENRKIWADRRFYFCAIITVTLLYLILDTMFHMNSLDKEDQTEDYSDNWFYEDGTAVDFDNLSKGKEVVIHKRGNMEEVNDRMICFHSKNVYFSIYLDDDLIYDFHPDAPKIFGKAYGVCPHSVNIPIMNKDGVLRIVLNNIYPKEPGFIKDICLDNGNQFLVEKMQDSAPDFLLCLIVFVFGIILLTIGFVGRYFKEKRGEIISVGTFAMVSSLWVACETDIFPMIIRAPVAVHFMEYMALDLLGISGIMLVTAVTDCRRFHIVDVFAALTAAKIGFSIFSVLSGGPDYHQLLIVSHVLLSLAVIIVLTLVGYGIKRHMLKLKHMKILFAVLVFSIIMGVIDIIRYVALPYEYNRPSYYKYSMFLFIIVLGSYEFYAISEMSRRGQYAEIMEDLAYKDGLTGLMNRMAYNREIERAGMSEEPVACIMLDMNYLKRVNDEIGHDMGDKYILKVAEFMNAVFDGDDKCFRIGGDEFFVLGHYGKNDPRLYDKRDAFKAMVEDFNKTSGNNIPLSIAYGHAVFIPGKSNIEDVIREADKRMYKMKVLMKAARV